MKFVKFFFRIVAFGILCVICLSCTLCAIWEGCYRIQEKKYYSDKNNFVSVTAVCVEIDTYSHYPDRYYLIVENMVYEKKGDCKFIDNMFNINEANSDILKEANVEEKLAPGKSFTCMSAPEYFGDGYKCPIVYLEVDGEVLLDFETGYKNLMKTYGVTIP